MGQTKTYSTFFLMLGFLGLLGIQTAIGQDLALNEAEEAYEQARTTAYKGDHRAAKDMLVRVTAAHPEDLRAQALLASTYTWIGEYGKAREVYNLITSQEKDDRGIWISAIKNELYAKNGATALGLANKAMLYLGKDREIDRLRELAVQQQQNQSYAEKAWFNQEGWPVATAPKAPVPKRRKIRQAGSEPSGEVAERTGARSKAESPSDSVPGATIPKVNVDKDVLNNRLAIRNALTVFDQRYEPIIASSVSFKRQTLAGSIIPRINYNNRNAINGMQYELDFYPKFSKRFYAYLNYGYSAASIYPNHKFGGDLYINLPGAMEFSAGGRYIDFETRNVSVVTNSLGHYRGNYYFSLRSYITPQPDRLTRISGNLLVRKYGKDAENYLGINVGMGYAPELRQLISDGELLAETLLYVESQRLSLEYQFTGKQNTNIYRTNVGVTRQELAFDSGSYFWSVSAGFAYLVKF